MQYIREMFDPAAMQNATPIAPYKLAYNVSEEDYQRMLTNPALRTDAFYFTRSKSYFDTKPNAMAQDNTTDADLPFYSRTPFKLAEHRDFVTEHVNLYKAKYAALVSIDKKIIATLLLAIVAANTPFIPFVGLVSSIAWLATFYFLSQRIDVYTQYNDALLLLVGTCNWALGPKSREDSSETLSHDPALNNMMSCLYPVLSKKQVGHLIADDIDGHYTTALEIYDSRFKYPMVGRFFGNTQAGSRISVAIDRQLEDTALKQRGAEFVRCVYGLNRGSAKDFLRVLANAIPDLWRAARNAASAYMTEENNHSSQLA